MNRRHVLLTAVALLGSAAGCTAQPGSTPTSTSTPSPTPTRTSTPSTTPTRTSTPSTTPTRTSTPSTTPTTSPTTTPGGSDLVVDGPGDFPHAIIIDNSLDRSVTVTVTVQTRDDETVLYERTHTVEAETERVVAGFTRRTAPADQRNVRVTAALDGGNTESVDFVVDDCHGEVLVFFGDDGTLQTTYSVC